MKRIALVAAMTLLCMCMVGCASNSTASNQSGGAPSSPSSSSSGSSASSSETLSVGDDLDVSGSIIMVSSDSFVVDCSGIHFTCIPADAKTLSYVTAGNVVEVEGTIASIQSDSAVTLDNVTVDDYSDGYKNIAEHYEHHDEGHHHD